MSGDVEERADSKRTAPGRFVSWRDYWKAQGMPWRTEPEIDTARQQYLTSRQEVQPDIAEGIYPFRDKNGRIRLTRADVEWLLATHDDGHGPVDWATTTGRTRVGLNVCGADLSNVDLRALPLARLRASLTFEEVFEQDTDLVDAAAVALRGADLRDAHLEGAWLRRVHLDGADLRGATLVHAELYNAFLAGARLGQSQLAGASLRRAVLSADTNLYGAQLSDATSSAVRLRDIRWNGADVTVLDWSQVSLLGDEQVVRARRRARANDFPNAARANRQLAVMLRSVGLTDDADRFAYRAQVCERRVLARQRRWGRWFLQTLLAVLSGYGYRLGRIAAAYVLVVGLFTAAFLASGVLSSQVVPTAQQALDTLQISLNAIHGRVFFAQFHLDTVQSWLATAESIIGIVIEGVFVAMLVQRFFGGR